MGLQLIFLLIELHLVVSTQQVHEYAGTPTHAKSAKTDLPAAAPMECDSPPITLHPRTPAAPGFRCSDRTSLDTSPCLDRPCHRRSGFSNRSALALTPCGDHISPSTCTYTRWCGGPPCTPYRRSRSRCGSASSALRMGSPAAPQSLMGAEEVARPSWCPDATAAGPCSGAGDFSDIREFQFLAF